MLHKNTVEISLIPSAMWWVPQGDTALPVFVAIHKKVPFFPLTAIQFPETILDVPLCHEDHSIIVGLSECMDEPLKRVTQLVNSAPGSPLLHCVVD